MSTVFIGGSRRLSRLNSDVRRRLDRVVEKQLPVLIGDANGADKAVQAYLHARRYDRVHVFCSDELPRNNLGGWPVRVIRPQRTTRDFDYYATKDRAMADEATVGLMLWDGESRGTLLNTLRLITQHKPVVVYVTPRKAFTDVRSSQDFDRLVAELNRAAARRLQQQAAREGLGEVIGQTALRL